MPHKKLFQPYRHNGRFFNHPDEKHHSSYLPSLMVFLEWFWTIGKRGSVDTTFWYEPIAPLEKSDDLTMTWIGHSTFLIQVNGVNILTDPVFGHLPFFRRQIKPGIPIQKIPNIDYVLISHNHRDHMDSAALSYFKDHPECTFLVPLGDKEWFTRRGFKKVKEYTWWERDLLKGVEFTFLPSLHWSQRGFRDFNASLWGSWMISSKDQTVYFGGDTAYGGHFSAIAKEFPTITHALMPIGPCEPRKWMSASHMSAEEAGQAFLDLNAHKFIPMHWGTFSFGTDHHEAPYERILSWWHKQKVAEDKELVVLKAGQRYTKESVPEALVAPAEKQPTKQA